MSSAPNARQSTSVLATIPWTSRLTDDHCGASPSAKCLRLLACMEDLIRERVPEPRQVTYPF